MDREARLLKVVDLLVEGTRDGSLEWDESYGGGYQTTLSGQTLVLEKNVPHYGDSLTSTARALAAGIDPTYLDTPGPAILEVRGRKGEVLERIENPKPKQGFLFATLDEQTRRFSEEVVDAVERLYQLVANRKQAVADAAIDSLLGALEGRVRTK